MLVVVVVCHLVVLAPLGGFVAILVSMGQFSMVVLVRMIIGPMLERAQYLTGFVMVGHMIVIVTVND